MREHLKLKTKKVAVIVLAWMIAGLLIALYDYVGFSYYYSKGPSEAYSIVTNVFFNLAATFIGGVLGGGFLVFYVNEKFRNKSYGYNILAVILVFISLVVIITLLLGFIFVWISQGSSPFFSDMSWEAYMTYLLNPLHFKNVLAWSIVVTLTQFFLQINDKFGQGVLWNFILGKYHSPREEERIFMFLDIKDSTSIAENLGSKRYYQFLKDFYADITNSIIYNHGEIYQYVGDEVVISWKMKRGISRGRCVKCFFDIEKAIQKVSYKYMVGYGFIPEFKAGIHYGTITAGEVGIIKRDITFSGDVLNTTSRIQSLCNTYDVRLLLSDSLLSLLNLNGIYAIKSIGIVELKGKTKEISLSSIAKAIGVKN